MTISDAILAELMDYEIPDNLLTKALLDNNVSGSQTYASSDQQAVDTVLRSIYLTLATQSDIKQGSYVVKYDSAKLFSKITEIEIKWGIASNGSSSGVRMDGTPKM